VDDHRDYRCCYRHLPLQVARLFRSLGYRLSEEELSAIRQSLASGARLVDVRTPREFSAGHIDGAVNLPVGELQHGLEQLKGKKTPLVVYCRSGSRSEVAASYLRSKGFKQVLDMKAMSNWRVVQQAM
jgi:rhodanese-related sulfurtransferase